MGLKLNATNGGGSVELDVPDTVNSDLALTVPATAGEVAVVATDGSVDLGDVNIDSSGNVGIGTTATEKLHVDVGAPSSSDKIIAQFQSESSRQLYIGWDDSQSSLAIGTNNNHALAFHTNGQNAERMRLSNTGVLLLGKTAAGSSARGAELRDGNVNYAGLFTANSHNVVLVNRLTDDGILIRLRQANADEGSISVSGSTVSYNGAHLSRWSQLASGAARIEILRGSVLSNLDEMCEWAYEAQDAVLYTDEDELPEGASVGDVKEPARDAGTEDNEQLNRMKVSDVEGDVNVSGVFQAWDDDDDTYVNDFYCAMTGDFVIRIAQGTTVARGDLLMSAGDGTAKPQDDDIVRSKTIAKVTSTTVSCTYSDGSYCVPCVLMAC